MTSPAHTAPSPRWKGRLVIGWELRVLRPHAQISVVYSTSALTAWARGLLIGVSIMKIHWLHIGAYYRNRSLAKLNSSQLSKLRKYMIFENPQNHQPLFISIASVDLGTCNLTINEPFFAVFNQTLPNRDLMIISHGWLDRVFIENYSG